MPRKFQKVVTAPPILSASQPPTGRMREPTSGPRNVRYATLTGSILPSLKKCVPNWFCRTWPNANPKPMNEPNVPM